jgi:RNA polymerase sigma-70 factor (ECF subfamily)
MRVVKIEQRDELVRLTYKDTTGDTFTEDISFFLWEQICELNQADRRAAARKSRQNRRLKLSEYIEGAYDFYAPETDHDPVCDLAVDADSTRIILDAIDRLTETQRRRLLSYCAEGLTYQQVAEREGATYSPVYRSIQQAIGIIRKLFE